MGKSARIANRNAASSRSVRARKRGRAVARTRSRPRHLFIAIIAALSVVVIAGGIVIANHHGRGSLSGSPAAPVVGRIAPNGMYTSAQGKTTRLTSFRGTPMLLWFVSTWCPSCQVGTQTMAQNITRLSLHHVRVVELELAGDLGQPGPTIASFGQQFAGHEYTNPNWMWGVASSPMTQTYDPNNYLDIYYLLNAQGRIVYVNGSPGSTMASLLHAVEGLQAR